MRTPARKLARPWSLRKRAASWFGLLAGALALPCVASENAAQTLKASLGLQYATGTPDLDDSKHIPGLNLSVSERMRFERLDLFAESRLQAWESDRDIRYRPDALWRQLYAQWHGDEFDLRMGRQLILWGRADRFNPTDNITPVDYRLLGLTYQEQRFGTVAANYKRYLSENDNLQILFVPWFRSSQPPAGLIPAGVAEPDETGPEGLERIQGGMKLDHAGTGWDGSLSAYHGSYLLPLLNLNGVNLERDNPEFTALGADFALTWEDWVFRGEAAYTFFADKDAFPEGARPFDNLFLVAGMEKQVFGDDLIQVQGLWRWFPDYAPSSGSQPVIQALGRFNAASLGQFRSWNPGAMFSYFASAFQTDLEAEAAIAAYLRPFSQAFSGRISYRLLENWMLSASGLWLRGPTNSDFGALRKSSRLLMEVSRSLLLDS